MITCPKCSAQNDPSNRFCDQCGFRLEGVSSTASAPAPAPAEAAAAQPTAPAMNCPSCGAAVLPGEAFCDVCGASLQGVGEASATANDAPTVLAPPAGGPPVTDSTVTSRPDAPTADAPIVPPLPPEEEAPATAPSPPAAQAAPPAAETAAPATSGSADYEAERARLGEQIATQQRVIDQMEQMRATFGAATPPAILEGLKQAQDAKAKAEADLQALVPPKPAVDPAEVARLEEQIATQQRVIDQMEQMRATFGAATPPAILDGLKQAQDAKAKAEADLQALTGGASATASTPPTPPTPPADNAASSAVEKPATGEPTAMVPTTDTAPPVNVTPTPPPPVETPTPPPVQAQTPPPAQVAPAGPRLIIVDGGKELPLPADKAEIIVGREDPISQIFPEIDLTPFGGETGGVSRQHARITQANGQWMLTDLNSTNYTRVDGVKIDPQVAVPIRDGSRLQFGRIAATFHM